MLGSGSTTSNRAAIERLATHPAPTLPYPTTAHRPARSTSAGPAERLRPSRVGARAHGREAGGPRRRGLRGWLG